MEIVNAGWFQLLAGLVITLATGFYFGHKFTKEPLAFHSSWATGVIGLRGGADITEHIRVLYKDAHVPRLSVMTVAVWNAGNAVLDKAALVDRDPLRITVGEGAEILEVQLLSNPHPPCGCTVNIAGELRQAAHIKFDYLDRGQGLTIRVLHTGHATAAALAGSLKGVQLVSVDEVLGRQYGQRAGFRAFVIAFAIAAAGTAASAAVAASSYLLPVFSPEHVAYLQAASRNFGIATILLCVMFCAYMLLDGVAWGRNYRVPESLANPRRTPGL